MKEIRQEIKTACGEQLILILGERLTGEELENIQKLTKSELLNVLDAYELVKDDL